MIFTRPPKRNRSKHIAAHLTQEILNTNGVTRATQCRHCDFRRGNAGRRMMICFFYDVNGFRLKQSKNSVRVDTEVVTISLFGAMRAADPAIRPFPSEDES